MHLRRSFILPLLFWSSTSILGQPVSFSNLNTSNGLSDNFIRSLAVDKNGLLWIGTNEGLNVYDGYNITSFHTDDHPGIPSKTVYHLNCDNDNNIWMGSAKGVGWVDAKRNFRRVVLFDTLKEFRCGAVMVTKSYGPVLFTEKGQFFSDKEKKHWQKIDWLPSSLVYDEIADISSFDENRVLVTTRSHILLIDYASRKITWQQPFKDILSACRVYGNKIALADLNGQVIIVDIATSNTDRRYDMPSYGSPGPRKTNWAEVRMGADETILYSSNLLGFYMISKDGKVNRYRHDPTDPWSIAGDRTMRLLGTKNGDVIIGTERYGLSICNILTKQAGYQRSFRDAKGNFFDGYLTEMQRDKDGTFWIGAADRLIHWDREKNISAFYFYNWFNTGYDINNIEVHRVCIDRRQQIWVSLHGVGPAFFDRKTGKFQVLERDTLNHPSLKSNFVYALFEDSEGKIWASCRTGFYFINPVTKKIEIPGDSLLKRASTERTHNFAEDSKKRIWFSTIKNGVYCYDPHNKTLRQFTTKEGLLSNDAGDLMMDSRDNLYITMYMGFNVISPNGTVRSFTRQNGLRFDKADAFLEDNDGNIWISNAKCLAKLDTRTNKLEIFDERENLNKGGFKPVSSLKTPDGELLWGTQSGINYFYPHQLHRTVEPLQLSIHSVLAGDSSYTVNEHTAAISFSNNSLTFGFVAVNLRGSHNIRYQYKLEGYDDSWQEGTDIRQARYSSLPPGKYHFKVRASIDRDSWTGSSNSFQFSIAAPLLMRPWFRVAIVLLVIGIVYYVFRHRTRQLEKKKEELETEKAIHYFAASLYEHQSTDDILWDVARNCIGRLHFEDCVIYLVDEKKNVLVQKAAHGPKSPRSFEINKPIDIPIGKGIVGTVAKTGKPEIIADTSKDSRYIVDDEARLSEISVPIVSNGKVLGVIDCEHSKKRFFTQKHLSILTTIASLCANKLVRARAEEEKKHAEIMLAETKQKMAEAEMQALRAQMNPHFIFNCLNSINRYIVKSDQATASLYLTRFAKLIRLILDNSHSKNVALSNEIEALRLYIEMESLRFDNKFTYDIKISDNVPVDSIEIPPLIIQPYIENAIWHGLLHKESGGHLQIQIKLLSPGILQCVIEDNGVGRDKAAELKSKSITKKKSLGMELTENRLLLLSQHAAVRSSVEIQDMKTETGEASGTKVILIIPVGDN